MEYIHFGALFLGIGAWLIYWKRKRAFNRTNEYGVERFPSYRRKVFSVSADFLIDMGGKSLLSLGVLLIAFQYVDTWGGLLLLPLFFFVFVMTL
ncbi:MAG: hypothetical protein FIB06_05510 [Betaproteobacteria bacterium]|nr:hypothetical protein [Betaproteobacteria bacterium]